MSVQHTPGPWRVEQDTTLIWGDCNPDDKTTYGMGYPVASCQGRQWQARQPDWDTQVANAHLIAAAPDFAAVAPDVADILDNYAGFIRHSVKADDLDMHPYLPHLEDVAAQLRAALAKARGAA